MYGYCMAKVDIKGAFVQTPMEGPDVYMRIRRKLVAYLLEMYPQFADYVQADGSIVTHLQKAMYGCVQASKLWYNLLLKVLKTAGYVVSEVEPCVMRKVLDDMIFIILIYVDDLLIFAMTLEMDILRALLTEAFKSITMEVDQKLSYLGMQIVWSDAGFDISMEHYVKQLLGDWPNVLLLTYGTGNQGHLQD